LATRSFRSQLLASRAMISTILRRMVRICNIGQKQACSNHKREQRLR
jgi:hypothetical protein